MATPAIECTAAALKLFFQTLEADVISAVFVVLLGILRPFEHSDDFLALQT
jgi:hypothetical protein